MRERRAPIPGTRVQGDGRSASAAHRASPGRALRVPARASCARSCARRKARTESCAEALHLARKLPVVFYQRRKSILIRTLLRPVCLAVALAATAPGYAVKLDPQDAALLAARDAFEANQRTKLATLAPQLK